MVSPPRQVIVDDSNTQIHYGAGWFPDQGSQDNVGNYGPTYKTTSHGTKANDSLSFSFNGSSVTVWGTTSLIPIDNGTSFDPIWECFVDGKSIGATKPFQFAENNWPLCQKTMTDGHHVITVNVTTAGNTFWFDYLTFTPSPGDFSATLFIQNTDSAIVYDDSWEALGGVANMTRRIGSKMQFTFVGTSLAWYGFIPTELPHNESSASYSIDGGDSTRFVLKGLPPDATTTVYNQEFFTTPDIPIGNHTIVVIYEGSDTPLTLDYLLVTHAPLPVTTNTDGSSPAVPTFTSSSSTSSPTVSSVPTASPTPHSSTLIGPIIGGVIGGLVTIVILLFALSWWHRRRASHVKSNIGFFETGYSPLQLQTEETQINSHMRRLQVGPFTLSYPFAGGGQPSHNVRSQSNLSYAPSSDLSRSDRNNSSDVNQSIHHAHNTSVDTSDVSGYAAGTIDQIHAERKNRRVEPIITPVVHQDSGIRLSPSQDFNILVEDLPPMYTTN